MNSGNIHCTHIHVHTGRDLGTAERDGGEGDGGSTKYRFCRPYICTWLAVSLRSASSR